jgi:acetyl-CoA acetyltransferase family protein
MTRKDNGKIKRVAVVEGCRIPFQRSGTGYYDLMAWELGHFAVKGLMVKTGIDPNEVDHVLMGCVAIDMATHNVAREIALSSGLPQSVPAHTCSLACVSSNAAVVDGANLIATGNADIVIAGGVDTCSDAAIKVSAKYRRLIMDMTMFHRPKNFMQTLTRLMKMRPIDFVLPEKPKVGEYFTGLLMGQVAERLVKRLGISRREQDEFALLSHQRAVMAQEKGILKKEIVPVVVPGKDKAIEKDNGPRPDMSIEKLGKLRAAFDRKYGTVTAATSSFLTDGATSVMLMSEEKAREMGIKPKAYIAAYAFSGQDLLEELLLGPAFCIPKVLDKAGITLKDVDVLEIHEAFASQIVGNAKCLASDSFCKERLGRDKAVGEIDFDKLNIHGGSLSLGHPFGATGGRLVTTCVNRMVDEGKQYGIATGCGAGALGNAILFENAN